MATRLALRRKEYNISQLGLEKLAGIAKGIVCKIENGHIPASVKVRRKIAELLQLEDNQLFDSEGWAIEDEADVHGP